MKSTMEHLQDVDKLFRGINSFLISPPPSKITSDVSSRVCGICQSSPAPHALHNPAQLASLLLCLPSSQELHSTSSTTKTFVCPTCWNLVNNLFRLYDGLTDLLAKFHEIRTRLTHSLTYSCAQALDLSPSVADATFFEWKWTYGAHLHLERGSFKGLNHNPPPPTRKRMFKSSATQTDTPEQKMNETEFSDPSDSQQELLFAPTDSLSSLFSEIPPDLPFSPSESKPVTPSNSTKKVKNTRKKPKKSPPPPSPLKKKRKETIPPKETAVAVIIDKTDDNSLPMESTSSPIDLNSPEDEPTEHPPSSPTPPEAKKTSKNKKRPPRRSRKPQVTPNKPQQTAYSSLPLTVKCLDPTCSAMFPTFSRMMTHVTKSHNNQVPFQCAICSKLLSNRKDLIAHRRVHKIDKLFPCKHCNLKLDNPRSLKYHESSHSGQIFPCPFCSKQCPSQHYLQTHIRSHTSSLKCPLCPSLSFQIPLRLRRHTFLYHPPPPETLTCHVCFHNFTDQDDFKAHESAHDHLKCSHCGKIFNAKYSLERHVLIHEDKLPYSCTHCPKSFRSPWRLQVHTYCHTGAHPYICDQCGKRFAVGAALKNHLRKAHPDLENCAALTSVRLHCKKVTDT